MGLENAILERGDFFINNAMKEAINNNSTKIEQAIDSKLGSQWGNNYNPDEYTRRLYDTQSDFLKAVQFLDDSGINYAAVTVDGQAIIEIPNEIKNSETTVYFHEFQDAMDNDSTHDETVNPINYSAGAETQYDSSKQGKVDAFEIFETISKYYDMDDDEYQGRYHDEKYYEAPNPARQMTSQMDALGTIINRIEEISYNYKRYGLEDDDIFKTGEHRTGNSKTAEVVYDQSGNEVVIKEGKIATGPDADDVLKQHHARLNQAYEGINSPKGLGDWSIPVVDKLNLNVNVKSRYQANSIEIQNDFVNARNVVGKSAGTYTVKGWNSIANKTVWKQAEENINSGITKIKLSKMSIGLDEDDLLTLSKFKRDAVQSNIFLSETAKHAIDRAASVSCDSFNYLERDNIYNSLNAYSNKLDKRINSLNAKLSKLSPDSEEYKSLKKQLNELCDSRDKYNSLSDKFKLTDEQKDLVKKTTAIIDTLNKDLGLNIQDYITRDNFLVVNAKFLKKAEDAGYQFVKGGKIDVEMLKGLTAEQLKEIGISSATRDFLVKINSKGSITGIDSRSISDFTNGFLKVFGKIEDSEDWQEFFNDVNTAVKSVKYTHSAVVNVKKLKYLKKSDIKALKSGKTSLSDLSSALGDRAKKKTVKKAKKIDPAKSKTFIASQAKLLKLRKRFEKSPIGKYVNFKENLKKQVVKKGVGLIKPLLIKFAAPAAGGVVVITSLAVVLLIILMVIQGLLSQIFSLGGLLLPSNYSETAAYCLYAYMDGMEGEWLDTVMNYYPSFAYDEESGIHHSLIFENREDMYYGIEYESFDNYINNHFNGELLRYDSDTDNDDEEDNGEAQNLYINPFAGRTNVDFDNSENRKKLTKPKGYDGEQHYSLASNANQYKAINLDGDDNLTQLSIEDGHTKNAKDILAMVDVMYQFDIQGMADDTGLMSIMGQAPAQINWEHTINQVLGTLKWACNVIKDLWKWMTTGFDGKFRVIDRSIYIGGTVSFQDVQNYVTYLWQSSHQQTMSLDVKFFPMADAVDLNNYGDGSSHFSDDFGKPTREQRGEEYLEPEEEYETRKAIVLQQQASEMGVCMNPVKKAFPIQMKSDNTISPYLEDGNGYRYNLDVPDSVTGVIVGMDNIVDDEAELDIHLMGNSYAKHPCVWEDFSANAQTKDAILNLIENDGDRSCWKHVYQADPEFNMDSLVSLNNGQNGVQVSSHESSRHSSSWLDSEESARNDLTEKLRRTFNDAVVPADSYEVEMTEGSATDPENFLWFTSQKPAFYADIESPVAQRQTFDHNEYKACFKIWFNDDSAETQTSMSPFENESYVTNMYNSGEGWRSIGEVYYHHNESMWDNSNCAAALSTSNSWFYSSHGLSYCTSWVQANDYHVGLIEWWWGSENDKHWVREYFYTTETVPVYRTEYQASGKVELYRTYRIKFVRQCLQHLFKYCGGHIGFHSQGNVYTITNEQLAMTGIYSSDETSPIPIGYDMNANGYDEIRGKHDSSRWHNIEIQTEYGDTNVDATAVAMTQSGQVDNPINDPQGSYIGSQTGAELWIEGGEHWSDGDGDDYIKAHSELWNYRNTFQDIFDVDTSLDKSNRVFPIRENKPQNFEGWTADNITLACMKFAVDWNEVYGFEIPLEITCIKNFQNYGQIYSYDSENDADSDFEYYDRTVDGENGDSISATFKRRIRAFLGGGSAVVMKPEDDWKRVQNGVSLSQTEIDKIVDSIKAGPDGGEMTPEREEAVRLALAWVGRGHYNEKHEHDFLCQECQNYHAIQFRNGSYLQRSGGCTAGTPVGFAKYIYACTNGNTSFTNRGLSNIWHNSSGVDGVVNRMSPADIIYHKEANRDEYNNLKLSEVDCQGKSAGNSVLASMGIHNIAIQNVKRAAREGAVIYIGRLGEDVTVTSWKPINPAVDPESDDALSTAATLHTGSVLTISLELENDIGNVWLHTELGSDVFYSNADKSPYWVMCPDNRTRYVRF